MTTTLEFTSNLGRFSRLRELRDAIREAEGAGFTDESYVSFRERDRNLTLVVRWEIQDCLFVGGGACTERATYIAHPDGGAFCGSHSPDNYPAYDDDLEVAVPCACGDEAVIRISDTDLCAKHAAEAA